MLDMKCMKWKQVKVADDKARLWHTGCLSKDGDVLIYGGCCNDILSPDDRNVRTIAHYYNRNFISITKY